MMNFAVEIVEHGYQKKSMEHIMGKIVIDLDRMLIDLNHLDGFCRGYFKKARHDYHKSLKDAILLVEREKKDEH